MKGRRDGEQNKTRDVFSLLDGGSGSEASRAYFGGTQAFGQGFVGAKHTQAFASWEITF
jgi:hypothetical protein